MMRGYNWVTVLVVANLAFSGLLVSWVMKFADSIMKVRGRALHCHCGCSKRTGRVQRTVVCYFWLQGGLVPPRAPTHIVLVSAAPEPGGSQAVSQHRVTNGMPEATGYQALTPPCSHRCTRPRWPCW